MLKLRITDSGGVSRELDFAEFPVRIGREDSSDIVTGDSKTSRRHAVIELDEGSLYICDQGSSNGCFLNSARVEREKLSPGDKLRLGNTRLEIREIDGQGPPAAPEVEPAVEVAEAAVEEPSVQDPAEKVAPSEGAASRRSEELAASLARRRKLAVLGPVLVLILLGVGGYFLFDGYVNQERPAAQWSAAQLRHRAALDQVGKFAWESGHLESITPDFLNRIAISKIEFSEVKFRAGEMSFSHLDRILRDRRQLDVNTRMYALVSRKDILLRQQSWKTLFEFVEKETAEILRLDPSIAGKLQQLSKSCTDTADENYEKLVFHSEHLEGLGQYGEALDTIAYGRERFKGTEYMPRFDKVLAGFRERTKKRIEEEKQLLVQRRSKLLKSSPVAAEEKPLSLAVQLAGLLKSSLSAVDLAGSAEEIAPSKMVSLAGEKLSGKNLLLAARFAFNSMLAEEGGKLLLKYLGKEREKECVADSAAARLLADARGLEEVPEGGFTYTRGSGWEDTGDRTQRLALVETSKILKKFRLVKSEKKLNDYFGQLVAVMSRPELPAEGRELIRAGTIEELGKLREKTSRGLERMVKHTAFSRLKKAREELDKRRVEAIRIIYDSKIYLPESHADWPRGDEINGQKEVDEAVELVREIWNSAASFAISLDKSTNAMSELIRTIEESCYSELKYSPAEGDKGGLQDLRNNLDRKIDLKSFALNRADLDAYTYNRKVEGYNESLKSEDIAETDKQHAVVLNDYREMMGRRRLFLDERLCRATRKHSAVCDSAGKIWHSGSDGSPSSRAKAEGFPSGVGENIAIGYSNPVDTWERGWYRASDHHRNGLGGRWTCLGYGYAGRVGTQNFSAIPVPFK